MLKVSEVLLAAAALSFGDYSVLEGGDISSLKRYGEALKQ